MNIVFSWLEQPGVVKVIEFIYNFVKVIRIIVPIGLIVMTTLDIIKKVINPNEKDGQKKIMIRVIAAVIVFFIPLFIQFIFKIANIDIDNLSINTETTSETKSLSSLNIINCPKATHYYNPGDRIILHTDIPNNYGGSIKWVPRTDHNVFKIVSGSNSNSVTLEVVNKPNHCFTDVSVFAGGLEANCVIVVTGC